MQSSLQSPAPVSLTAQTLKVYSLFGNSFETLNVLAFPEYTVEDLQWWCCYGNQVIAYLQTPLAVPVI